MKTDVLIIGGGPGGTAFRKLLKRKRDYDHPDDYSIPIGSRYHPERAALWEPDSPVGTTEEWISEAAPSKQRLAGAH